MTFELLQYPLRIEAGVGIIEAGDKSERDDTIPAAINPCAAVFARGQRPAHCVDDFSGSDATRRNLPELFHSLSIGLRIAVFDEVELFDELFGQRSPRTLGENDDLRLKIVARLEVRFGLVLLVETFVIGADAGDAVSFEQQLGSCKTREHRDPRLLDFSAQPLHKSVERNDVIAVVAQRRRSDGQLELALLGEKVNGFLGY